MNVLILIIGTCIPSVVGWLALVTIEGTHPVLGRYERVAWSISLGTTLTMFIIFLTEALGIISFTLVGYLSVMGVLIVVLAALNWKRRTLFPAALPPIVSEYRPPRWAWAVLIMLLVWTAIKLLAGTWQLWTVPTYWDDSFNNWNMRGKVYYLTEQLTLEYDIGNDVSQNIGGVSSYPPTVPLMKTWLSVLRGSWQEPLVNGVHIVWFLSLLGVLGFWVRRRFGSFLGWLSVYGVCSLPLVLIHGTNPYADVFVATHVLMATIALTEVRRAKHSAQHSWLLLGAVVVGALTFTKNEALLLYAPILTLLFLWELHRKRNEMSSRVWMRTVISMIMLIGAIAVPWMVFKWLNGLTFGNAKSVGETVFAFNALAVQAIWFSVSKEPNLLLVPVVLLSSLILRWRVAFLYERSLTIFVLFALVAQFFIFTFVPTLATEAIQQTGLARGMVQLAPSLLVLLALLWLKEPENTV